MNLRLWSTVRLRLMTYTRQFLSAGFLLERRFFLAVTPNLRVSRGVKNGSVGSSPAPLPSDGATRCSARAAHGPGCLWRTAARSRVSSATRPDQEARKDGADFPRLHCGPLGGSCALTVLGRGVVAWRSRKHSTQHGHPPSATGRVRLRRVRRRGSRCAAAQSHERDLGRDAESRPRRQVPGHPARERGPYDREAGDRRDRRLWRATHPGPGHGRRRPDAADRQGDSDKSP